MNNNNDADNEGYIDKKWFENAMKDRGMSQRQFAKRVGLDPSQISLLLSGKRRTKKSDILMFAENLNAPVNDVLRAVGIPVEETNKTIKVPLLGIANEDGIIQKNNVEEFVKVEAKLPSRAGAIRLQAVGHFMDGWVFVYDLVKDHDPETIRTLSIINNDKIGIINRGYSKSNEYNIQFNNKISQIEVNKAFPVVLIIP